MKLRSPPVIAAALALAGIAGGVTVNVLATRISEADRAAIVAWESEVARLVADARALSLDIEDLERTPDARLEPIRRALDDLRDGLASLRTPEIMERTAGFIGLWHADVDAALGIVERVRADGRALTPAQRSTVSALLHEADDAFHDAREALLRLRCRARVPSCEETVLPA